MCPPHSRRSFLAGAGVVGLSTLAGCSGLEVSGDPMPLRVINASDSLADLEIGIHGGATAFDEGFFLSAHSQRVFDKAIKGSDTDYEFEVEVTVNGESVLWERHRQTYPDEFVLVLTSLSEASFTKAPFDETDRETHPKDGLDG